MPERPIDASRKVQTAMQMNHILAAGSLMQVIAILGDDRQLGHMAGKFGDSVMRPIWLRLSNLLPAHSYNPNKALGQL